MSNPTVAAATMPYAVEPGRASVILANVLGPARWSDDKFLDALRQCGDDEADRCATELARIPDSAAKSRAVFAAMQRNDSRLPDDAPQPLREFFDATYHWCQKCRQPSLPPWVDRDRVLRGQQAFNKRSSLCMLVLLCKSLPEGYAAAGATKILNLSGELEEHTYHRLMGTLQLLVNVSSVGGFERAGKALVNAHQMRLLHAGVRAKVAPVALERRGGYQQYLDRYGVPVNQEDMLATIMAFSLLVVRGLRTLGVPFTDEQAEDYYYVWRVFAHEMGIHPSHDPANECHLPETLADAATFYETYCRRHYPGASTWQGDWAEVSRAENPDGCKLTERHMKMLATLLPPAESRLLDLEHVTRIWVEMLIGEQGCARVALARVQGHVVLRFLLRHVAPLWARLWRGVDDRVHTAVSEWFYQKLVDENYRQGIVFTVPATVQDLKDLVDRGASRRGSLAVQGSGRGE